MKSGRSLRRGPNPPPFARQRPRPGLTLVEMLVAMAITLLMMAAVVNIFANVGQSVRQRRAGIEMANMVRTARNLLQADLTGHTCTLLPWTRPEAAMGYFEIVEGRFTDHNPSPLTAEDFALTNNEDPANWRLTADSTIPISAQRSGDEYAPITGQSGTPNMRLSGLGDFDDILAFTTQRFDRPFKGRFGNSDSGGIVGTVESPVAEVVWFAVENPVSNVPGAPEAGLRTVYRRTLLVAPWLANELAALGNLTAQEFFSRYDISARKEERNGNGVWIPNTLADLTRRENRFGRWPGTSEYVAGDPVGNPVATVGLSVADPSTGDNNFLTGFPFEIDTAKIRDPLNPWLSTLRPLEGNRAGEDIVLTNVLAFDIRVYDPLAPVVTDFNDDPELALAPTDVGWSRLANVQSAVPVSQGAYVDLGYGLTMADIDPTWSTNQSSREQWANNVAPSNPTSMFSWEMHPKSGLLARGFPASARRNLLQAIAGVYDTWSLHYEYDGHDQDSSDLVAPHLRQNALDAWRDADTALDEGADGIDNDKNGGVDEASERETSPPYPYPLRGIEIRFRTFEPDSGAIREVSVQQNFAPQ